MFWFWKTKQLLNDEETERIRNILRNIYENWIEVDRYKDKIMGRLNSIRTNWELGSLRWVSRYWF